MKKSFLFAASVLMLAMVSCTEKPAPEPEKPEAKTAKENLVLYLGFEADETPGTGIALVESKGSASLNNDGFIGKCWTNTSGNNMTQAYTKYSVAANSAFSNLKDITFTAWVKLKEECSKGALMSLNGMPAGFDWPLFIAYFDNLRTNEETGVKEQQVNGRLVFHDADGNEQNVWLDTWDAAFAKFDTWFQFAFTYTSSTGAWALYVDGVEVKTAEFLPGFDFCKLLTNATNTMYIGGWASFIEGASNQDWQSYFAGSMDEIRIYNKALTAAELSSLRKEELAISLGDE